MSGHPGYFGGSTVRDGKVRRLQADSFKDYVQRYLNVPAQINLTRKEFLAHPDRDKIKDGPWISPCAYPYEDEGKRGNQHATKSTQVAFDFDEGEFVKDIDRSPEALRELIAPFNFVLWRTAKYTKDAPRLKLLVEIEPSDPRLLPRYIAYLRRILGLPYEFKGEVETRTVSQPHYRPVKFKGEEFDAIRASRVDGREVRLKDLPDAEEELEELLGDRQYGEGASSEEIGLDRLPVAGVTLEDIRDALQAIDPDCDMMTWVRVGMAMKHQFPDEDMAHEAFEEYLEWSGGGDKFPGREAVYARWRSFHAHEGRPLVTVRTIFKLAMAHGWNSATVAGRHRQGIDEWIAQCQDSDELMQEGPGRIAALPFRSEVVEDDLVLVLQKRLQEITGRRLEKRAIVREIGKARRREKSEKQEKLSEDLPNWLRPFCYVSSSNQFHSFGNGMRYSPEAFNNTFSKELMPPDGAETPPNGRPIIAPSDFARNIAAIPIVDDVMYCPLHQGEDPFFTMGDKSYLNLYNPMTVPIATPENSQEAGGLLMELVRAMIEEPSYQEIFVDSLAAAVQFPGRKYPWGTMIQSEEGAGKNFLGKVMAGCIGGVNVKVIDADVICSNFNDFHTQGCVICIINELHIPGERRERITNAIKPLITDDVITIKEKYQSVRNLPNYVNYLVFTNYRDAIHLKPGDRRWFVIFSKLQTKADIARLTATGIFDRLEILMNEWAGALRYWFLHRKISPDFPWRGPPPATKYRQMVIDDSTNPLQEAIDGLLQSGHDPMIQSDVVSLWHLKQALPQDILRRAAKTTHYLQILGFEKWGGPAFNGRRSEVWYNPRELIDGLGSPPELLDIRGEARGSIIEI